VGLQPPPPCAVWELRSAGLRPSGPVTARMGATSAGAGTAARAIARTGARSGVADSKEQWACDFKAASAAGKEDAGANGIFRLPDSLASTTK
jgi:hypothetical protein